MTGRNTKILYGGLLFFILLETGFQTFFKNALGIYWSPLVWMLGALGTCFVALKLFLAGQESETSYAFSEDKKRKLICSGIFLVCSIGLAFKLNSIFAAIPVKVSISDIIPSLQLYVTRFLSGATVYEAMDFGTYKVLPTYFPLLWMPYSFSEILNIDYRWTAYLVFLLVLFLYNRKILKQDNSVTATIIKSLAPFVLLFALVMGSGPNFGMAVELLPSGFYLLLCLTVLKRSVWVMGFGILLCLMSRYAFTFWLPVYFLVIWMDRGFFVSFKTGLVALLGVVLVYIIPFFAKDPTILTDGLKYYATTAETQWVTQSWQEKTAKPFHLIQGLSFAVYFYDFAEGEVKDKLQTNRKVHIGVCAFAALLILLGYFYYSRQGLDAAIYMIIALKFYLTIFYGFFYVPFSYLYMLPLFLTVAILYELSFNWKTG